MTTRNTPNRRTSQLRGSVILELLAVLPVLLIFLLAIVELGTLMANLQQLAGASRAGAHKASQANGLSSNPGSLPGSVRKAVEAQLSSAGISGCGIAVEHNVNSATPIVVRQGSCECDLPETPLPGEGEFVRVTVCVPLAELTPNLLSTFGFNIQGRKASQSTLFRYER